MTARHEPTQKYPPMTPQEAATALGVPLTQQLQPALADNMPTRFVTLEEAQARGWSMFWIGKACRLGHQAARFVSNPRRCSGCDREKKGLPQVYPTSAAGTFYKPERIARKQPDGTVAAPTTVPAAQAPVKPLEPSKRELDFLAALAMTGDFDGAASAVKMTRGQVEARASVDEVFRKALEDMCARHSIPWTRAPEPAAFTWTAAIERQLAKRFIDTGLLEQARTELGIAASDYQRRLQDSPAFSEMIEGARPAARETLRERATALADRGKPELLKFLEDEAAQSGAEYVTLVNGQRVRRSDPNADRQHVTRLLEDLRKKFDTEYPARRVLATREIISREQLVNVQLDTKTGRTFKPEELEDVPALVLNVERNAKARSVKPEEPGETYQSSIENIEVSDAPVR